MKKNLLMICSFLLLSLISCNNDKGGEGKLSAQAQKNLDAVHLINKAVETGDVSTLDKAIAADAVDHTSMGECKGIDSIKSELSKIHTMATDMKAHKQPRRPTRRRPVRAESPGPRSPGAEIGQPSSIEPSPESPEPQRVPEREVLRSRAHDRGER